MRFSILATAALATALAAAGTFSYAQSMTPDPALSALAPEQMVTTRQDLMKANGATLRGAANLTGAEAVTAAETILANYTNFTVLFPEGSAVGETEALPSIWTDNATFLGIFNTGIEAATAMKAAAEAGDAAGYEAAVKAIGGTCGQCHQAFRS